MSVSKSKSTPQYLKYSGSLFKPWNSEMKTYKIVHLWYNWEPYFHRQNSRHILHHKIPHLHYLEQCYICQFLHLDHKLDILTDYLKQAIIYLHENRHEFSEITVGCCSSSCSTASCSNLSTCSHSWTGRIITIVPITSTEPSILHLFEFKATSFIKLEPFACT